MNSKKNGTKKPELHILSTENGLTVEGISDLFKALTGKDSTPEEKAATQAMLEETGLGKATKPKKP